VPLLLEQTNGYRLIHWIVLGEKYPLAGLRPASARRLTAHAGRNSTLLEASAQDRDDGLAQLRLPDRLGQTAAHTQFFPPGSIASLAGGRQHGFRCLPAFDPS